MEEERRVRGKVGNDLLGFLCLFSFHLSLLLSLDLFETSVPKEITILVLNLFNLRPGCKYVSSLPCFWKSRGATLQSAIFRELFLCQDRFNRLRHPEGTTSTESIDGKQSLLGKRRTLCEGCCGVGLAIMLSFLTFDSAAASSIFFCASAMIISSSSVRALARSRSRLISIFSCESLLMIKESASGVLWTASRINQTRAILQGGGALVSKVGI